MVYNRSRIEQPHWWKSTTFVKIPSFSYPGVAQLVGRLVWELEHGLHP